MLDARRTARAARLVHGHDDQRGYARRGSKGRFHYADTRGHRIRDSRTLARIRGLAIPPAWTDVWINRHARGHLQACGRDARGRKQYVYHADWRAVRDAAKYDELVPFASALPRLRRAVRADLRRGNLDSRCVTAVVVRLLETSLIRIGNDAYARANGSYGLTTLRGRHVRASRGRIHFRFRGKSGQRQAIDLTRPRLARLIRRIQELPGQELFRFLDKEDRSHRLRSDDVNVYLRDRLGGEFTAKHFRTWAGTVLAACALAQLPRPRSAKAQRRAINLAVREVASRLGNTPAIARRSYIHPAIVDAFSNGRLPPLPPPERWPPARTTVGLAPAERRVLRLLARSSHPNTPTHNERTPMAPSTWNAKDERQYKKIVDSARSRGTPPRRAREIAARTVNKTRRKQGRTPNKTTQGTGNPQRPLADRSRQELYNRARQLNIRGRSTMDKAALARAIRERG